MTSHSASFSDLPLRRRSFLSLVGAGTFAAFAPALRAQKRDPGRVLVLVQLKGGNDGLNTVIPFDDDHYHRLRPQLGLRADERVPIGSHTALHAGLAPLLDAYAAGELAIVQGVGYPAPNRSHFRSSDIWHAASASDQVESTGWLAALAPRAGPLFGLNIGTDDAGPLRETASMLTVPATGVMLRKGPTRPDVSARGRSNALAHVVETERRLADATEDALAAFSQSAKHIDYDRFGKTPFAKSLAHTAALIIGGAGRVFRVQLKGFDTHKNQRGAHARLMGELGTALAAFRQTLRAAGRYDDVTLATYAEFGRRVKENKSGGTDHGTAAAHFVLGGRVRGGLVGDAPSLTDLDRGDLRFSTDYRRVYRTLAEHALGRVSPVLRSHAALPLFRR